MADITWSWPRPTCAALAPRQVAPWRWEMSATSSLWRRTAARLHPRSRSPFSQRRKPVEGAGDGADRGIGNAGVKRRGVELGVAEERLDHADIDALLEQVGGEAVPQRVRR